MEGLFSQQLWAAAGLQPKGLRIARSYFFPDSDYQGEEPSTSYSHDDHRSHRKRGGRHAAGTSSNQRHGRKRMHEHEAPQPQQPMWPPLDSSQLLSMEPYSDYTMPASAAALDTEFLTRAHRKRRADVRRPRSDVQSLLSALNLVFPQPLTQPALPTVDGGLLLPLQDAACADAPASCEAPITLVPQQQQQQQQQHEVVSLTKKVKWYDEQESLLQHQMQAAAKKCDPESQPASATHSASSSQGVVFASELSSPERISHWAGHHQESSEELA